jgi:hypothetical protein
MSIGGVVGGAAYAILGILNMYDAYYGFPCLASICLLVTTLFIGKDIDGCEADPRYGLYNACSLQFEVNSLGLQSDIVNTHAWLLRDHVCFHTEFRRLP